MRIILFTLYILLILLTLTNCAAKTSSIVSKANELQTLAVNSKIEKTREEAIINFAIDVARFRQQGQNERIKIAWKELKFNLGTVEPSLVPTWNELDKLINK